MRKLRVDDHRILFPWEQRRVLFRWLDLRRMRPVLLLILAAGGLWSLAARERRAAGVRQTRARILDVRHALDAYLADNEGACPTQLAQLASYGSFGIPPLDAWGRPLRLVCPGRSGRAYDLYSDGPDGKAGGLDRIE